MKKLLVIILFLIFSSLTLAQDIVYDSIRGDRNYWFRAKGGENEQFTLALMYENQGMLTQSKVISSAGILDGLIPNKDYKDYSLPIFDKRPEQLSVQQFVELTKMCQSCLTN